MSSLKMFDQFLVNPTTGYQRSIYGDITGMAYALNGDPWFTWAEVPIMKQHPAVQMGLSLARTPYSQYRLVEKDEAKALKKHPVNTGNPKADAYVRKTFNLLFKESLPVLMDSYHSWGRFAAGVEFAYDRKLKLLNIENIRFIEPFDTDPKIFIDGPKVGQFAGFKLVRSGVRINFNQHGGFVGPRHAFYFAGHERIGPGCDMPRLAGACTPWKESTAPGGARASRRLSAFTRAVGITEVRYPAGAKVQNPIDGSAIDAQDAARYHAERCQNGYVSAMPNTEHATMKGEFAWSMTQKQAAGGGPELQALIEYNKQLDSEIWLGMLIPEEVFQTGNAGSFSGRSVVMESWLSQHDEIANMIWAKFKKLHLNRLLKVNFGITAYTADLNSLLDDFRAQAKAAGQGGQDGKPADPNRPPAERGPDGHFAPRGSGQPPARPDAPDAGAPGIDGGSGGPAMLSAFESGFMPESERRHHAAIALAMVEAKLRELGGLESADSVQDLVQWLPHLAHDDEAKAFRAGKTVNLGWVADGTSKSGKPRWINPATKERRYQKSEPGSHTAKRAADQGKAEAGLEIAKKIRYGEHAAGDLEGFIPHLHSMNVAQLRQARRHLQAGFGNETKRDAMVAALTNHVRQRIEDANTPEEPAPEPTPRKLSGAALAARENAAKSAKRPDGTPVAPHVTDVHTLNPAAIKTDPTRFQYKTVGIGKGGVTDELKGTSKWNPELGGTMLVWRDPTDGHDYVVNGHHRHELALRTGTQSANFRYIDAPNATAARARGALANIAEGRGTATDAAKYMRDSGSTADDMRNVGISLSGKLAADANELKDLSDTAFQKVAQGQIKESTAVSVAKHLKDPKLQDSLFKLLDKRAEEGKDWNTHQIETAAKKMAKAGSVTEKGSDLFGDFEDEKSTFAQEVELESHIGRSLQQKVNDFHAVANTGRAERVKGAGNQLAVEENARQRDKAAGHAEDFERESGRVGPVAEAIKAGAAKLALAKPKERDGIKNETLEHVRKLLEDGTGLPTVAAPADAGGKTDSGGGAPGVDANPSGGTGTGIGTGIGTGTGGGAGEVTPPELPAGYVRGYDETDPTANRKRLPYPSQAIMKEHVAGELEKLRAKSAMHTGSKAEVDATIAAGGREIFRGMADPGHAAAYRAGTDFVGQGDYGHGRYYATGGNEGRTGNAQKIAEAYAQGPDGKSPGEVVRSALKPDAKIITAEDLAQRIRDAVEAGDIHALHNDGLYARELGFDAIESKHNGYLNVVNPDALHVQSDKHWGADDPDPADVEPAPEPKAEPGTDLFGRTVKKTWSKPKGQQADLNDLARTVKIDKAKEWAAERGLKIDQYIGTAGTFRVGNKYYHVGPEAEGHRIYESNIDGEPIGKAR